MHLASYKIRFNDKIVSPDITVVHDMYEGKPCRYLYYKNPNAENIIILVHGAPGSAGDMLKYLEVDTLRKRSSIISIDRLGYGYTHYGDPASIKEQVEYLNFILEKNREDKYIYLVGHSYGGAIVGAYAAEYDCDGILLLAAVIDPFHEKMFWFSYPTFWKGTCWLFPGYVKVAGFEKKNHEKELMEIKDIWSSIDIPVIMVHDSADYIAPGIENISWATEQIQDSLFYFLPCNGDSHFVPFSNEELTTSMILQLLDSHKN